MDDVVCIVSKGIYNDDKYFVSFSVSDVKVSMV